MKKTSFLEKVYGLKSAISFSHKIGIELELEAWIDRENEIREWENVIQKAINVTQFNPLVFIIGDYGMGKTLSLRKIVKDHEKDKDVLPIYLNFKSEEKVKKPGLDFIQRIFKNFDFDKLKITESKLAILKDIYPDVYYAFKHIFVPSKKLDEYLRRKLIHFLRGEVKLSIKEMREIKIVRNIVDVDVAKEYLIGLLYIILQNGYKVLLLAIDEFEYLFSIVPKSSQSIYLALLRSLKDLPGNVPEPLQKNIANLAMFIAISNDGLRRLTELEKLEKSTGGPIQPLMMRVERKITLGPLSKKDTRKLIEKRLSLDRIKGRYEKDPLIPFTTDFVEYIYKLTGGRPRDIIDRCDIVLDEGLQRRVPRLTASFARKVFQERGYTYDVGTEKNK